MKIRSHKFQGLFQEAEVHFEELPRKTYKKDLSKLAVDMNSLRGFFMLGGVDERTQELLDDIYGPTDFPNRELLLTFNQTQSFWKKSPTYFYGPKENFVIAINLAFHYREVISYYDRKSAIHTKRAAKAGLSVSPISPEKAKLKTIEKYFKASYDCLHEEPEFEETIKLYKGIKTFDEANSCREYNLEESKKKLRKAEKYFCEILKKGQQKTTAITFLGLIEALLGKVESALLYLVKAADLVFNPSSIYKIMAKLYKVLRMENAALFYRKKSLTGHRRLRLVS